MKRIIKWVDRRVGVLSGFDFPIERVLGKSFSPPELLPHYKLLEQYDKFGRNGFDWEASDYVQRTILGAGERYSNFDCLPDGLDRRPIWWMMPWGSHPGKKVSHDPSTLKYKALRRVEKFFDLYESIKKNGYDPRKGGAISGYLLIHPSAGALFNQIDGHHRLVILTSLARKTGNSTRLVRVRAVHRIHRDSLCDEISFKDGVSNGRFTKSDAYSLFDFTYTKLSLL